MLPLLLILIPFLTAVIILFIKNEKSLITFAFFASCITLVISISTICNPNILNYTYPWIPSFGSSFSLHLDGLSKMLCLLNAIALPIILLSIFKNKQNHNSNFLALLFFMQVGMMGVFLASDALLFYFFWELALIPAYFLCSIWGGEKRIQVTIKFFIYTFVGSLLMLIGLIYLYLQTKGNHSFDIAEFYNLSLSSKQQNSIFALLFIAFAIKMPIFPLHTWQPDTYEQSPTPVTMLLSGVMVKMGLYAVLRWIVPIVPNGVHTHSHFIIILSVIGMLYASLIAIKQDDIKRLVAYSSIAHIGLMCASIFTNNNIALNGMLIQMFNHGINVIGLWIAADVIEKQFNTRKFSELGGLAQKAPTFAILFVIIALANIALPLTNAFVGEFLMFTGLFEFNIWIAAIAGISIILAAVYTLNMVQKIFYGNTVSQTEHAIDITWNVKISLFVIVILIIVLGVYPMPLINLIAH